MLILFLTALANHSLAFAFATSVSDGTNATRFAICFIGNTRSMWNPRVHLSVKYHFLNHIDGPYTIFADLNNQMPYGDFRILNKSRQRGRHMDLQDVEEIVRLWGGESKHIKLYEKETERRTSKCPNDPPFTRTQYHGNHPFYTQSCMEQMTHRYHCLEAVEKEEKESGVQFTNMITIRPDLWWIKDFEPSKLNLGRRGSHIEDEFIHVPRHEWQQYIRQPYDDYWACRIPGYITKAGRTCGFWTDMCAECKQGLNIPIRSSFFILREFLQSSGMVPTDQCTISRIQPPCQQMHKDEIIWMQSVQSKTLAEIRKAYDEKMQNIRR